MSILQIKIQPQKKRLKGKWGCHSLLQVLLSWWDRWVSARLHSLEDSEDHQTGPVPLPRTVSCSSHSAAACSRRSRWKPSTPPECWGLFLETTWGHRTLSLTADGRPCRPCSVQCGSSHLDLSRPLWLSWTHLKCPVCEHQTGEWFCPHVPQTIPTPIRNHSHDQASVFLLIRFLVCQWSWYCLKPRNW